MPEQGKRLAQKLENGQVVINSQNLHRLFPTPGKQATVCPRPALTGQVQRFPRS